ncbi:MAG: NTP transferase domain-containing protein [Spirochaetaceae bacterium]|jgi:spore coat polysaccharide biosynthesis protein SpsF|nr:NTP transferase domain-containing protein [Spirochaetaceae bacterium]
MTALVLQGRLDSTRLPGKSLLPLDGEPLIFRVMEALSFVPCDLHVLACPEDCEPSFRPLAERAGFELCTGSKEDVLARYCAVITRYSPDRVIRATADNPFVFADAARQLAEEAAALNADYAGYAGLPLGAGVEAASAEALLRAEREAQKPEEREHVCPYLYGHPELFRLHRPLAPLKWRQSADKQTNLQQSAEKQPAVKQPPLRLTVDTPEDYRRAQELYRTLNEKTAGGDRCLGTKILEAASP